MEKLSSNGEKHVAMDLAVSIARDVAFALTELHAKHIIHRDIKSENVLIDLDKKRQDGTPVVKICDFDRAIPLHSYSHTCCIAHVGVPPADICVGTPRWMAPEVFRAMHKRNMYGLVSSLSVSSHYGFTCDNWQIENFVWYYTNSCFHYLVHNYHLIIKFRLVIMRID